MEEIARIVGYVVIITVGVGIVLAGWLWIVEQLISLFRVKKAIIDWAIHRAEQKRGRIITKKPGIT